MNNKIYVYENESGDKGFIVTDSYDEAEKLHHEEYPRRRIIDRNEKNRSIKKRNGREVDSVIKIKQGLENGVNGSAEIVWKDKTDYDDAHYITVIHVPQFRNKEFHLHIYDKRKIYKASKEARDYLNAMLTLCS